MLDTYHFKSKKFAFYVDIHRVVLNEFSKLMYDLAVMVFLHKLLCIARLDVFLSVLNVFVMNFRLPLLKPSPVKLQIWNQVFVK
jgi:hypothetical protein